jgi:hypothetical protein
METPGTCRACLGGAPQTFCSAILLFSLALHRLALPGYRARQSNFCARSCRGSSREGGLASRHWISRQGPVEGSSHHKQGESARRAGTREVLVYLQRLRGTLRELSGGHNRGA